MVYGLLSKMAEYNVTSPSNFVKYTSAVVNGFGFGCQTVAMKNNKKVPENQRNFMANQLAMEGVVSTGILLALSSVFQKAGEKLVEKGLVVPSSLPKELRNPKAIANILKNNLEHADALKSCKGSLGLGTSVLGIILSMNILTPFVRNELTAIMEKGKKKGQAPKTNNTPNNPTQNKTENKNPFSNA